MGSTARPRRYSWTTWGDNDQYINASPARPIYAIEIAADSDVDAVRFAYENLEGVAPISTNGSSPGAGEILWIPHGNPAANAAGYGVTLAYGVVSTDAPWRGLIDKPMGLTAFYGDTKFAKYEHRVSILVWHEEPPPWAAIVPHKRTPLIGKFPALNPSTSPKIIVPAYGRRGGVIACRNNDGVNNLSLFIQSQFHFVDNTIALIAEGPSLTVNANTMIVRDIWKVLSASGAPQQENNRPHVFFLQLTGTSTSADVAIQLVD